MEPQRILIVDDDPAVCEMFGDVLSAHGYEVVTETLPLQAMPLLREGHFDAMLLDLAMPELDGLTLLKMVREEFRNLPILVVTGYGGADATVEAMRRGATDFVSKPVDAALLSLRIKAACNLEHHRRLANTDGLTGLYNHRFLQERLQQEVERAGRYGRPLALIMADLDHFKRFNDAYGHPRGDEVLIQVAQTLRQASRATDFVARYGGEELTLVLPETQGGAAVGLAERIRQCIAALDLGEPDLPVTISLGVAAWRPGCSRSALVRAADTALYEAKRRGRNRVCVAELDNEGGTDEIIDAPSGTDALA